MKTDSFRRGDIAQVRSAAEILATLDPEGKMEGLPFMPEMARLVGQRFTVVARGDKICDTIHYTGSRRLGNSVILDCARCDGSGHDGCQAECKIFWKEAWLKKVDGVQPAAGSAADPGLEALLARVTGPVQYTKEIDGKPESLWMCQNTELFDATKRLNTFNPLPYINTYLSGDVPFGKFVRVSARAAVEEPLRALHLSKPFLLKGPATTTVTENLNLQPGEWVQVRSLEEIRETLTAEGRNGGMWFDREMAPYCGGTYRVRQRITKFIDEFRVRGKMVKMVKFPAVTLDEVVCTGTRCTRRWFCPREITLYWRECWLRRVDAPVSPAAKSG